MTGSGAILSAFFSVFTGVATWIVEFIPSLLGLFWAEGALTLLGVLMVAPLALSVIFLIVGMIQGFFHWRG